MLSLNASRSVRDGQHSSTEVPLSRVLCGLSNRQASHKMYTERINRHLVVKLAVLHHFVPLGKLVHNSCLTQQTNDPAHSAFKQAPVLLSLIYIQKAVSVALVLNIAAYL
jgi:hypothetical protein